MAGTRRKFVDDDFQQGAVRLLARPGSRSRRWPGSSGSMRGARQLVRPGSPPPR